jgi:hypothetical protein
MPAPAGFVGIGASQFKIADTGTTSVPLINGTGPLLMATTPNDGNLHLITVVLKKVVVTTETAGAVGLSITESGGSADTQAAFAGGLTGPATYHFGGTQFGPFVVGPNCNIAVQQTSALTGGSSGIQAQIWSS